MHGDGDRVQDSEDDGYVLLIVISVYMEMVIGVSVLIMMVVVLVMDGDRGENSE